MKTRMTLHFWRFVSIALIVAVMLASFAFSGGVAETASLDETQRNAIAMLNYITVLTQEINASKNSRLYMEQAYSALVNNTYPNSVDSRTLSQLTGLLDTMESYRMVNVKRERLQYIYEQNQAKAIRAAVPNPLGLLSLMQSGSSGGDNITIDYKKLALAVVYMAVDSITSYTAFTSEANLEYLKDGWTLDDEASSALHTSRKSVFNYLIKMVNEYNLPGDLTLTESTVEEFVRWSNDPNVVGRIQYLESNQKTYQSYGGYWLTLSESYYENGDYAKCLEALDTYESMNVRIFRKDYDLARILPFAISAADEVLEGEAYVDTVIHYTQLMLDNTENSNWALRYFGAQAYIDLYGKTQDESYLQKAYAVALDNINYLIAEQRELNAVYLAPVKETETPKDATKDEKNQIKDYNKMLKENRKKELAPVSEPLLLNCELLFALARELNLSDKEQSKVDSILHPNGESAFLVQTLDARYWFSDAPQLMTAEEMEIEFGGTAIILPANCVTDQASITVCVKEKDAEDAVVLTDWKVDKVERVSKDDFSSFQVAFTSEEARKHNWAPDAEITIDVVPRVDFGFEPYHFEFTAHGTKNEWYDYLKVWEGHKNNWYDYGKVWENSVVFERTK